MVMAIADDGSGIWSWIRTLGNGAAILENVLNRSSELIGNSVRLTFSKSKKATASSSDE